jgi:hypothetical protein
MDGERLRNGMGVSIGYSRLGVPRLGVPRLGVLRLGVPRLGVPRLGFRLRYGREVAKRACACVSARVCVRACVCAAPAARRLDSERERRDVQQQHLVDQPALRAREDPGLRKRWPPKLTQKGF